MGIFDKAKDLLNEHSDKVNQGIDKAADLADKRTGGQHASKIDSGAETAKQKLGEFLGKDEQTPTPTAPPAATTPPPTTPPVPPA